LLEAHLHLTLLATTPSKNTFENDRLLVAQPGKPFKKLIWTPDDKMSQTTHVTEWAPCIENSVEMYLCTSF
jgi:hypothetical protein